MFSDEVAATIARKARDKIPIPFGRINPQDLPDPYLWNIHHALGRVLHTSGAAEVLTRVLRDEEELQSDGPCLDPVPVLSFYLARRLAAEAAMGGQCENDSESESESESKDSVGRSSLTSLVIV